MDSALRKPQVDWDTRLQEVEQPAQLAPRTEALIQPVVNVALVALASATKQKQKNATHQMTRCNWNQVETNYPEVPERETPPTEPTYNFTCF